jgi:hypothetical protein
MVGCHPLVPSARKWILPPQFAIAKMGGTTLYPNLGVVGHQFSSPLFDGHVEVCTIFSYGHLLFECLIHIHTR